MSLSPTLTIKENDLFLIADRLGNTVASKDRSDRAVTGLFCQDTRFLSCSQLTVEGYDPILLHSHAETGFSLCVACTNPEVPNVLKKETLGIQRQLALRGGLFEEIEIYNYDLQAVTFQVKLQFYADFLDLFEVREYGDRPMRGNKLEVVSSRKNGLSFAYRGLDNYLMETQIQFSYRLPDEIWEDCAIWNLHLDSHEQTILGYHLTPYTNHQPTSQIPIPATLSQAQDAAFADWQSWYRATTRIRSDRTTINQIIERAEQDMYLLLQSFDSGKVPAAGIPWFSALFGRDSLVAAFQTLMFTPSIARDTLLTLGKYQGEEDSDWHEEAPGKILHELRQGEMARCREIPHTPYYGTVDATPLWLLLYAEYYAWTGDRETIERLWDAATAAMSWIDSQCAETGYLSYQRRSSGGIDNQGWKDSGDAIVNSKGEQVFGPIALCEVQAYVYAAKQGLSRMAELMGKPELARRWRSQARALQARFNRDFWIESADYCALALDGQGQQVDSITSNPGQCLCFGIFYPEKAARVARTCMSEEMFSGWGIRTLSSLSPAYNPISYHLGSVWPHDSALVAAGLRSLGWVDAALTVAAGLLDMTHYQPSKRPPELLCGYQRRSNSPPINYPVACSPQAWATGSVFQLLQMMLNPIPDAANGCLRLVKPRLPAFLSRLSIHNLQVGNSHIDLELERQGEHTACRILKQQGNIQISIEP
ncbi:amylo-alpha-1,6-glucosidase [Geitlerinema sp. PCC 9228]|uniref:amylo-alpha-1,6-glucosidase n=1 Tax=Geitlerinema sp. PCC 9228 TaxID=111611 RepID=UPI0008F9BB00|nr:amylo-alpha-1,6-glucosidase [Geitlerinema sp. PCC 9228]